MKTIWTQEGLAVLRGKTTRDVDVMVNRFNELTAQKDLSGSERDELMYLDDRLTDLTT